MGIVEGLYGSGEGVRVGSFSSRARFKGTLKELPDALGTPRDVWLKKLDVAYGMGCDCVTLTQAEAARLWGAYR